jgi:hypothetical protein
MKIITLLPRTGYFLDSDVAKAIALMRSAGIIATEEKAECAAGSRRLIWIQRDDDADAAMKIMRGAALAAESGDFKARKLNADRASALPRSGTVTVKRRIPKNSCRNGSLDHSDRKSSRRAGWTNSTNRNRLSD